MAFALGYVIWGVLLASFFEGQMSSADLPREAPVLWAGIVGTLANAMLVTLAIGWTGGSSMMDGLKTGALVGFLMWLAADLIIYANFDFSMLTGALADSVAELVHWAVAGAAIGAVIGGSGGEAASTRGGGGDFS